MKFDLDAFAYFIENPSAWSGEFDQRVSDQMAAARAEIERLRTVITWADQNPESRGAIFRNTLEQRDGLLAALNHAMTTIKALHGPVAWDIYERSSPEVQRYKAAIAEAS